MELISDILNVGLLKQNYKLQFTLKITKKTTLVSTLVFITYM